MVYLWASLKFFQSRVVLSLITEGRIKINDMFFQKLKIQIGNALSCFHNLLTVGIF